MGQENDTGIRSAPWYYWVDPAYDTGVMQGPRYFPQDHAAPGSVGDRSVCHPMRR